MIRDDSYLDSTAFNPMSLVQLLATAQDMPALLMPWHRLHV